MIYTRRSKLRRHKAPRTAVSNTKQMSLQQPFKLSEAVGETHMFYFPLIVS